MFKSFYSTAIRNYQHILPNPPGFEVWRIKLMSSDRRVVTDIIQCPETYLNKAKIIVPSDRPVYLLIYYRSHHVLGAHLEPLSKMFRLFRKEAHENK